MPAAGLFPPGHPGGHEPLDDIEIDINLREFAEFSPQNLSMPRIRSSQLRPPTQADYEANDLGDGKKPTNGGNGNISLKMLGGGEAAQMVVLKTAQMSAKIEMQKGRESDGGGGRLAMKCPWC